MRGRDRRHQSDRSKLGPRERPRRRDDSGQVLLDEYRKLLNERTKLVAVSQVSNAPGSITPVARIAELAQRAAARVSIDGAQSVSHMRVKVRALGADFQVFQAINCSPRPPRPELPQLCAGLIRKLLPPHDVGVLLEKRQHDLIADAVGRGSAIDYSEGIGLENIGRYEHGLLVYAMQGLQNRAGPAPDKHGSRQGEHAILRARGRPPRRACSARRLQLPSQQCSGCSSRSGNTRFYF